jgi:diacylglycerol O-acyltransferase / wax synthase
VTNVPGPQFPLYVLGRELRDLFPVAFLPENQSLAVAIMSYNGAIDFGLLGDYDAMPDIAEFGDALAESLAELVHAARGEPVNGRPRRRAKATTPAVTPPA